MIALLLWLLVNPTFTVKATGGDGRVSIEVTNTYPTAGAILCMGEASSRKTIESLIPTDWDSYMCENIGDFPDLELNTVLEAEKGAAFVKAQLMFSRDPAIVSNIVRVEVQ
jgi:hypothetical protein